MKKAGQRSAFFMQMIYDFFPALTFFFPAPELLLLLPLLLLSGLVVFGLVVVP